MPHSVGRPRKVHTLSLERGTGQFIAYSYSIFLYSTTIATISEAMTYFALAILYAYRPGCLQTSISQTVWAWRVRSWWEEALRAKLSVEDYVEEG
jgi:hypothetical protein